MKRAMWIAAAGLLVVGCGKKDGGDGEGGSAGGGADLGAAMEAANKLVPQGRALAFALYEEPKKKRFSALVPDGWKESQNIPGSFEPPEGADLGFSTRYSVGTNCDGACEPKDWAAVAEKVNFKQLRSGTVTKEEDLPGGGKLMVASSGTAEYVQVAKWSEKSRFYVTCRASLSKEAHPLLPAFEAACRAITAP